MNYPQQYIQFLKIIYQETYSQRQNNAYFCECIKLEMAVRQGYPLSFPLYCTQNDVFTNSVNKGFKQQTLKDLNYREEKKL